MSLLDPSTKPLIGKNDIGSVTAVLSKSRVAHQDLEANIEYFCLFSLSLFFFFQILDGP